MWPDPNQSLSLLNPDFRHCHLVAKFAILIIQSVIFIGFITVGEFDD